MRVLLLGGGRFIGRHVAERLLADHDVTLLNRGTTPPSNKRLHHLTADRTRPDQVAAALADTAYDVVVDISGTEPSYMTAFLDLATPYVYLSSASVYNRQSAGIPFTEGDVDDGDAIWGEYGRDKSACERLLIDAYGPDGVTILRPPYVYGPGNNEPRESFLWARMLADAPILVPGDGDTLIQFCHVDALAEVVAAAVDERLEPGTYNVAESTPYTFAGLLHILGRTAGVTPRLSPVDDPKVPARDYFPFRDNDLVLNTARVDATGVLPYVPLPVGLAGTLDWFKRNGGLAYEPTAFELSRR